MTKQTVSFTLSSVQQCIENLILPQFDSSKSSLALLEIEIPSLLHNGNWMNPLSKVTNFEKSDNIHGEQITLELWGKDENH